MNKALNEILKQKYNISFDNVIVESFLDIIHYGESNDIIIDLKEIVEIVYNKLINDVSDDLLDCLMYLHNINFIEATYYIGLYYEVQKKYSEALTFFNIATNKGHLLANHNIGLAYENGNSVTQDFQDARNIYQKLADQGLDIAQNSLGRIYEYGKGVKVDFEKALYWYHLSASQGNHFAQNNLGRMYRYGKGTDVDYSKAIYWYIESANQGNVYAQNNLGRIYELGGEIQQDFEKALYWYGKAVELNNSFAENNLARMYKKGYGVEVNIETAIYWYQRAVEHGNNYSKYNLAVIYEDEEYSCFDIDKAIYWYNQAAEDGNDFAQNNLGRIYDIGHGVEQNFDKAMYWYNAAIQNNNYLAQYNIAVMYEEGRGVEKNIDTAKKLYLKSIEMYESIDDDEFPDPYYKLGYLYYRDQDYKKAKENFEKALDLGINCEFILEKTRNKLGMEDKENYISILIHQEKTIEDFLNRIDEILGNSLFDNKSITQIKTGLLTYYTSANLGIDIDYSNCIIPMIKSLETEVRKYFVHRYRKFIEPYKEKIDVKVYNDTIDRIEKFKLGQFRSLIGFKEKPFDEVNISKEIYKEKLNFNIGKANRTYVINSRMMSYLKEQLFDLEKFSKDYTDEEIILYMKDLCEIIDQINYDYRNPSAHENIMNKKDAETVINWLLFNKKVLFRFFEKIK